MTGFTRYTIHRQPCGRWIVRDNLCGTDLAGPPRTELGAMRLAITIGSATA
jgi:hypothetical protein